MGGVHLLIGAGEAAITVAVLGAVLTVRPDLVHGATHLHQGTPLQSRAEPVGAGIAR
jgi:cobalt/nickel transport system permease protein